MRRIDCQAFILDEMTDLNTYRNFDEPRPMVQCRHCKHFTENDLSPGGIGRCTIDGAGKRFRILTRHPHKGQWDLTWEELALYPLARRICRDHALDSH